jgi:hypothetical protein
MSKPSPGIASAYAAMNSVQVPDHWSAEQALAVWELLDAVTRRVWERYEVQLIELIQADLGQDDDPQLDLFDPDDTIPF